MHTSNQEAFDLPSRLIAKKFLFRLIYGGTAYTYAHDPDFVDVSTSEKFWQRAIDKFCDKYKGWNNWWADIIREAQMTGKVVNPATKRSYIYEPGRNYRGELTWPVTTIKNYPVQGLAADLMSIARISFRNRFKQAGIEGILVNTVHDSIVVDCASKELERVVVIFKEVFDDLPMNFEKIFKVSFNLPLRCEVSYGNNMKELTEFKF